MSENVKVAAGQAWPAPPDGNDRPSNRRGRNTMRRLAVLGATLLVLSGCSLVGGSSRNEEIPPKPLAKELCDAIGAERLEKIAPGAKTTQTKDITGLGESAGVADASCDAMGDVVLRVVYTRYGQTRTQTPAQRVTKKVDKLCDDMRSGTWAGDQEKFNRGFRADPMEPPGTGTRGTCKISGRYDVLTKPHAKVSLVFGLKGDMVDIGLSKELSGSAELDDNLVKLMGTELTMLAIELLDGRL
jgi:hypothetical protein